MISVSVSPCSILMRSGAKGKFDPSVYGTLLGAWYADTGITLDAGKVSSWAPSFGTAGALAQATSSLQPTVGERPDGKAKVAFAESLLTTSLFSESTSIPNGISIVLALSIPSVNNKAFGVSDAISRITGYTPGTGGRTVGVNTPGGNNTSTLALQANTVSSLSLSKPSVDLKSIGTSSGLVSVTNTAPTISVRYFTLGGYMPTDETILFTGGYSAVWVFGEALSETNLALAHAKMLELYPEVAS